MLKNLALFALFCLSTLVMAQDGPNPKELVLGRKIFYSLAKDVREELKLTESQVKKIVDAFQGSLQVNGDQIMLMLDPSLDMEDCDKQAMKALDEGQRKRLEEVWIQELGAITMADDGIGKQLKLDESQKKSVAAILEDTAKEMMDLFMSHQGGSTQKEAEAIRNKASEKAKKLLSEEQNKTLESLKGKPFKRTRKEIG